MSLDFDLDDIIDWSLGPQLLLAAFILLVSTMLSTWFLVKPSYEDLNYYKQQESQLKQELEVVARKAAMLPIAAKQIEDLTIHYERLMKQLPAQQELASVLAAMNEQGLNNHLTFTRINWGKRKPQQFLLKLPIDIELTGSYDDIGRYTQAIAELPRIVLIENAEWQRVSLESSTLHFRVNASTYQYVQERLE
ncbi:type 4a pilus biogenesis protein PilO [Vibrio sp. SCSIO 43140]|uniref:type 4a pilus biogenesis protein PilO n=1 Tax=Vibrio sp. SCSIO 43140 TaxID=2819100 RepID=UPI002075F68D|nr:type 4a pilus biogenesis protein PilO [Vibrio sp. SCSIO 43140]USD60206.1 type 4a pilus biogenesis protein PilO [Vibrio sp. SCSIO 43140]